MKGAGGRFERQILASCPSWAWARKVPDPPARPFRCRCGGTISPKCDKCGSRHGHPATFTRGNPWDIEIRWKTDAGRFELLLECKSTQEKRLPFDAVKPDAVKEMIRAAESGCFAGVLWECRGHACLYIPVATWLALETSIGRKSLPTGAAMLQGLLVPVDAGRGRVHSYYQMDRLLRSLEPFADDPRARIGGTR